MAKSFETSHLFRISWKGHVVWMTIPSNEGTTPCAVGQHDIQAVSPGRLWCSKWGGSGEEPTSDLPQDSGVRRSDATSRQ